MTNFNSILGNFIKDCICTGCSVEGAVIAPFVKGLKAATLRKNSLINCNSALDKSITNYISVVVFHVENFV